MGTRQTYHEVLVQACIVAGDETVLAKRLGLPLIAVVDWLVGDVPIPTDAFLRAVDIVLTDTRKQVVDNRAMLDQIKRKHRR
jgi:hypothetical protein